MANAKRRGRSATDESGGRNGRETGAPTAQKDGASEEEQIRRRAYELYQQRAGAHGDEMGDWLQAEREYRARSGGRPGGSTSGNRPREERLSP